MDKINPNLRMLYPYSITGKMRWFPKAHYINNSALLRLGIFIIMPAMVWAYSKIDKVVNGPIGYGYLHKREAIYVRNKPFQVITEEMVK